MRTICAGAILRDGNRLLLGKRSPNRDAFPGVWDAVGGHCLPNETPEQGLIRELQEEIGVTPTEFERLAVIAEPNGRNEGSTEYHIYVVTRWDGTPTNRLPGEHSELRWFDAERAATLDLAHPAYPDLLRRIAGDGAS